VTFGWPLMLSFGVGAFSLGADRFFLAGVEGAAAVGAYGALSDLVRASLLVIAESISLATIPLAKRQFVAGETAAASRTLEQAFRLLLVTGAFFTAAVLVSAPVLLPTIFPPAFLVGSDALLPIVVCGALILVFRSIYLAQIIYFVRTSHLELGSSLVLTAVNLALCAYLIPRHGAVGAALAFCGGQIAAALFLFFQRGRGFVMPTPWRPAVGMLLTCVLLVVTGRAILGLHLPVLATIASEMGIFSIAFAATALAFGVRAKDVHSAGGMLLGLAMARK